MKTSIYSFFVYLIFSISSVAIAHSGHHAHPDHLHFIETAAAVLLIVLGITVYMKSYSK